MRALALALIVAVPSMALGQQKVSLLDPSFEQPTMQVQPDLTPAATTPFFKSAGFWLGMSAATLLIVSFIVAAVVLSQPPQYAHPLSQSQFTCQQGGSSCDSWINKPTQ